MPINKSQHHDIKTNRRTALIGIYKKLSSSRGKILNPKSYFYLTLVLFVLSSLMLLQSYRIMGRGIFLRKYNNAQIPKNLGQEFLVGDSSISLKGIRRSQGSPGFNAPIDSEYLVVDFYVKNLSSHSITLLPSSEIYAKNTEGEVSYLTPYSLKNPFRAGDLKAGDTIKGELSFLIKKSKHYSLYIDSPWNGGVFSFEIKN